jgi:hypothetical protein
MTKKPIEARVEVEDGVCRSAISSGSPSLSDLRTAAKVAFPRPFSAAGRHPDAKA